MAIDRKKFSIVTAIVVSLAVLPLAVKVDYITNILIVLFLYVILSQSWNVIGGYAGQMHLGLGALFGMGALTTRLLWSAGTPLPLSLLAGAISSAILAVIIGVPTLRLRSHYFAIGTLGVAIIAMTTVGNVLPGLAFLPGAYIASYNILTRYYLSLGLMVMAVAVVYLLVNSKLGLGMVCVRDDEGAAEATGVNAFKCKLQALTISSALAGLAGGGFAFYQSSLYYHMPFGLRWSFEPVLITLVGGSGTIAGPIIGSVFYVILKEIFGLALGEVNILIFGALFVLVVLFLPEGLIRLPEKLRQLSVKAGQQEAVAQESLGDRGGKGGER